MYTHSTSAIEPSTSTVESSTSVVDNVLIDLDPYSDDKSQKEMSKIKKQDKAALKKLIIKQCTEELISPAKLEKMHNIGRDTIKRWVKISGAKLPTKYNEQSVQLHTKKPLGPNEQTTSLTNELISNLKSKWPSLTGTETNVDLQNSPQASTSPKSFLCSKCDFKCAKETHLEMHLKGHYDCDQCGQTFFSGNGRRDLANHMKKHFKHLKPKKQEKELPEFKCEFCNFVYVPVISKTLEHIETFNTNCKVVS